MVNTETAFETFQEIEKEKSKAKFLAESLDNSLIISLQDIMNVMRLLNYRYAT